MPFKMITSTSNPLIKSTLALRERKERDQSGLTIIEGIREVSVALKLNVSFKNVFICPELLQQYKAERVIDHVSSAAGDVYEVTKDVYAKIGYGHRQEGVLGVCPFTLKTFEHIKPAQSPLFVVAERIEKPGNIGAILRTCDGAGVDALFISDQLTDVANPNVVRASMGTVFSVPVCVSSQEKIQQFLKQQSCQIVAASLQARDVYTSVNMKQPTAIVIGSEQDGLNNYWQKAADQRVKIPMAGIADSLNVSVSTAVLVYEARRQRL